MYVCRLSDVAGRPWDKIFKMLFFGGGPRVIPAETRLTVYRRLKVGLKTGAAKIDEFWGVNFALLVVSGFRLVVVVHSEVHLICKLCSDEVSA